MPFNLDVLKVIINHAKLLKRNKTKEKLTSLVEMDALWPFYMMYCLFTNNEIKQLFFGAHAFIFVIYCFCVFDEIAYLLIRSFVFVDVCKLILLQTQAS